MTKLHAIITITLMLLNMWMLGNILLEVNA